MHKAENLVITCMDYRMQKSYAGIISTFLGGTDVISVVGASRDLVKPIENWHRDSILRQIETSIRLHNPDNILLLDHEDCGGFAQDGTIPCALPTNDDRKSHEVWGSKAVSILKDKYPDKNIEWYYVQLDGRVTTL